MKKLELRVKEICRNCINKSQLHSDFPPAEHFLWLYIRRIFIMSVMWTVFVLISLFLTILIIL